MAIRDDEWTFTFDEWKTTDPADREPPSRLPRVYECAMCGGPIAGTTSPAPLCGPCAKLHLEVMP